MYRDKTSFARETPLNVLLVTSQWPDASDPTRAPFIVRQVRYLRQAGASVTVFHFKGRWNPIRYARAALEVRRRVAKGTYDVVHARFAQAGLVALAQRRLPVVVTYGGTDVLGRRDAHGQLLPRGRIQRVVARFVARTATANIVVSSNLAEALGDVSTYLIPDGLDLGQFRPMDHQAARAELGLPSLARIVLFVGDPNDVRDKKRYRLARDVASRAQEVLADLELVVVNNRPHREMPLYMNAADVLLLTSRSEGSPNVVKEALACNTPVVSVDVGDVRERLAGLDGCVVSDSDEPEVLARHLVETLLADCRIDGRAAVASLDENEAARKTIAVYEAVLGGREQPSAFSGKTV